MHVTSITDTLSRPIANSPSIIKSSNITGTVISQHSYQGRQIQLTLPKYLLDHTNPDQIIVLGLVKDTICICAKTVESSKVNIDKVSCALD